MSESEKILIEKSIRGDIESFEKLVERHQLMAFNIAYRMTGNKEDASDMTQEALIKAFKSLKNFRGDSSFSTWLFRIVTNSCIDMMRKDNRLKSYSIDKPIETDNGSYQKEIADNSNLPEEVYERKEKMEAIQGALRKLPDKYRIMVVLRDIQGFSYEEISEITNCPLGTVKSRISRGRLTLKEILEKDMELYLEK